MASVRYIVHDVDAAIDFYHRLGFAVRAHPAPGFAMLERDDLRLALSVPGGGGGGGQTTTAGTPEPGGWNRIMIEVDDLDRLIERLGSVPLRSEVIEGRGGRQVIADDPSGNPVELFQPDVA